jgi:outer membrane protein
MNQKFCMPLLLLLLVAGTRTTAQEQWDLLKCVNYALANNVSVKQADVQARLSALTLRQNKLSQYPTANFSTNFGVNNGRSIDPTSNQFTTQQLLFSGYNLNTNMNVFNWFSLKNTIAGNELDLKAAEANVDKLKNDIALNVATAYLLVLTSNEQVRISGVAVKQSQDNLYNTRKRVDAGTLPELNALDVEAQLARDSATLVTAKASLEQNKLQLKAVMNLDAATSFDVVMPPLDKIPVEKIGELQPDAVYALALANMPLQKVNDLKIKAGEKYVAAARGGLYPSVSLFGSLASNYANNKIPVVSQTPTGNFVNTGAKVNVGGTDYSVQAPLFNTSVTTRRDGFGKQLSENFRQNVGFSLNVPIFNGGVNRIGWERSKLNLLNTQLQQNQDNQKLKQDIYLAYTNALTALQKYNASLKTLSTSEKTFEFSQKRYDVGLLSTIDYLTSQNNLTRARYDVLSNQVDYVFRMKVLEFYKGLGIKLQ